jgi:chemotaxis protein MotB
VAEGGPQVIVRVKKKGGHGGHHGGAWKVAYADFVTAMMALFIVLWLLTQADLQLRQQIARYFRNASVLSGGSMIGETLENAKSLNPARPLDAAISMVQGTGEDLRALRGHARGIERMLEESPELAEIKKHVNVTVTDEGLEIQIVDSGDSGAKNLLFDVSSAELKPDLVMFLRKLATQLGKLPNRLRIGGHTDARPFPRGSGLTNWDLAFKRADNARRILEESGLRPQQVLSIEAYASRKLLNPDDPLADENRRLSVLALRQPSAKADEDEGSDSGGHGGSLFGPSAGEHDGSTSLDSGASFSPRFVVPGLPPS